MEPAWKRKQREKDAQEAAKKAEADLVRKQAFCLPPLPAERRRLSGSKALGDTIRRILDERQPDEVTLLVFDFDKTLTNGYATPTTSSVDQRVRGGMHTIEALRATLATPGVRRKVLTARPPTKSSVESVVLQLTGSMQLGEYFATDAPAEERAPFEYGAGGAMIAHAADVYASGYDKPSGISALVLDVVVPGRVHVQADAKVDERPCPPIRVHFFDDSVANAYRVSTETVLPTGAVEDMVGATPATWDVKLTAYWWDLYAEEFEEHSISPATPDADFALAPADGGRLPRPPFLYQTALSAFEVYEEEAAKRAPHYIRDAKA